MTIHDMTGHPRVKPRRYDATKGDQRKFTFDEAFEAAALREGDQVITQVPLVDAHDAVIVPTFLIQSLDSLDLG